MSQPTPYTPTTDFSQQEANNASGRSTVNTAALDAEFAAIDTTLDQTLANIQLLQRDDGRLMDVSVEVHTLSPEVLNLIGGYNLRGAWLANTDYAVNDTISHDSYLYVCKTAHNSGVTFSDINWIVFGFAGSNDAAQAAAQAAVSANEAHISELAAAASATTASGFATTATTQAGLASSSATAADASADAAAISETNAANSASDAASSASSISIPGGKAIVLKDSAGVSYVEGAAGTTAQRPGSPVVGYTRFNTTLNADETWSGSAWLVAGNVTQTGVETLTNKTLGSTQIGTSATTSENHFIDESTPNVLSIKRGTPATPGAEVFRASAGVVTLPASPGSLIQIVEATPYTTATSFTATIPNDSTIPQITEGQEFITVTITPKSATNRLRVEFSAGMVDGSAAIAVISALFQDATANALAASCNVVAAAAYTTSLLLRHEFAAGTTSPTTLRIRMGVSAGTGYVNRRQSGETLGGTSSLRLTVTEVQA